jgi:biotin carboxyl carrier protein
MNYDVVLGERTLRVAVRRAEAGWVVSVDGGPERIVSGGRHGAVDWMFAENDVRRSMGLYLDGDHFDAQIDGHPVRGKVVDPRRAALDLGSHAAIGEVRTQMPGAVVRVLGIPGKRVARGEVLVVVEAMKMENEFRSPCDGVVASVAVAVGQAVEAATLLAIVTPASTS